MKGLKEWATVVKALENGRQTVILRKGGILDVPSGFNIESEKFLLFPTYEHQNKENLKEQDEKYLEMVEDYKQNNDFNNVTSYAEVLYQKDVQDGDQIKKLTDFHIWSDSYIDTRRNWKPEKPIKAIFLKTFKIPPTLIPIKPEYHGCKSWIEINANVPEGEPVLNDAELDSRLKKFKEVVA
ncbi:MAG: DUF1802 family protein [Nitrosopumilaceae archaeon]|nr:DUF1802 family protein [Nitrosopumilaceae archaeon]NIU00738.1 DUF1802 family protein [Nitrosopumilaceae archaeon]NIU87170.1 DUF1802 family protein [Nitrosopumilaceae archaeon]NIV65697.1 DUF1802 family protein [Nitrosopumilaceae archaeon]NIX61340.1 DUF1802 family protein [Nitrosopumilaceae archaeon]